MALAEKMIEMNKQEKEETKGFLLWLEGRIGTEVEAPISNTKIRAYYEIEFKEFLAVLKKNKRKLGADPVRRVFQDDLRREFQDSMGKLVPLLAKVGETDRLIDEIVYRLYGLTDEEIEIVEKSLR